MMPHDNDRSAIPGTAALGEWIDQVADEFEAAWQNGGTPAIADFLPPHGDGRRTALVAELVKIDLEYRCRSGTEASLGDYLARFPELRRADGTAPDELTLHFQRMQPAGAVLPEASSAALDEDAPATDGTLPLVRQVTCPYCGNPVSDVPAGTQEVVCETCGSTFRLDQSPAIQPLGLRPTALGRFQLVEVLGEGSFGTVYKAHDAELGRTVAVKAPRSGCFSTPEQKARFVREARSAAGLEHPGIVQIYEIAYERELPFLVCQYIEGRTLAEVHAERPLSHRETAELVARVADALDYAHARHVVHRDMKPTNILVDASGTPHVTDFGLATGGAGEVTVTVDGQVLGTPAYMSPEQAQGDSSAADGRSDVYSLGVILYELLAGERPFRGNPSMLLQQVLAESPRPPRRINDRIPRDLETICLKAMEKTPARRYATAGELAADLRRFLDGETIHARPVGGMETLWRWCRRHALVASLVALVALSLVVGAGGATFFAVQANRNAQEARRDGLLRRLQLLRTTAHTVGWTLSAQELLDEAAQIRLGDDLRAEATATFIGIDASLDVELTRQFGTSGGMSAAFDRKGTRLLIGGLVRTGREKQRGFSDESGARLCDLTRHRIETAPRPSMGPVTFGRDGAPLELVLTPQRSLELRSVPDGVAVREFPIPDAPGGAPADPLESFQWTMSDDASVVAASELQADGSSRIWIWHGESGEPLWPLYPEPITLGGKPPGIARAAEKPDARLALSPDGSLLAAGNSRGEIAVWSVSSGSRVATLQDRANAIQCLEFHLKPGHGPTTAGRSPAKSGWLLAAGDSGGWATIWDLDRSLPLARCQGWIAVYALAFTPDGTMLASGGRATVALWDTATGRLLLRFDAQSATASDGRLVPLDVDYVMDVAFSPDGKKLAIAGKAGHAPDRIQVHVWRLMDDWGFRTLHGAPGDVAKFAFSSQGDRLAGFMYDWKVHIWNSKTGMLEREIEVPEGNYPDSAGVVFSPDGRRIAFSAGSQAGLWDVGSGDRLQAWKLPPGLQDNLAFDDSGRLLLIRFETESGTTRPFANDPVGDPFVVRVRDLFASQDEQLLQEIRGFKNIRRIAASALARWFLVEDRVASSEHMTRVFETRSGRELWSINTPATPDASGRYLSYEAPPGGGQDRVLVSFADGAEVARLPEGVLAAGPEGRMLVVTQDSGRHALVGHDSPRPLLILDFTVVDSRLTFSRDGRLFACKDDAGHVYLCHIERACRQLFDLGLE